MSEQLPQNISITEEHKHSLFEVQQFAQNVTNDELLRNGANTFQRKRHTVNQTSNISPNISALQHHNLAPSARVSRLASNDNVLQPIMQGTSSLNSVDPLAQVGIQLKHASPRPTRNQISHVQMQRSEQNRLDRDKSQPRPFLPHIRFKSNEHLDRSNKETENIRRNGLNLSVIGKQGANLPSFDKAFQMRDQSATVLYNKGVKPKVKFSKMNVMPSTMEATTESATVQLTNMMSLSPKTSRKIDAIHKGQQRQQSNALIQGSPVFADPGLRSHATLSPGAGEYRRNPEERQMTFAEKHKARLMKRDHQTSRNPSPMLDSSMNNMTLDTSQNRGAGGIMMLQKDVSITQLHDDQLGKNVQKMLELDNVESRLYLAHDGLVSHGSSIEPTSIWKNSSGVSPMHSQDELAARLLQESQQTMFKSRSPSFKQVPMNMPRSVLGQKPSAPSGLNLISPSIDDEQLIQVTQTPNMGSPSGEALKAHQQFSQMLQSAQKDMQKVVKGAIPVYVDWPSITGHQIVQAFKEREAEQVNEQFMQKASVLSNVFDDEHQSEIMNILNRRMNKKEKVQRQQKIISGQIAGTSGRGSAFSQFIQDQIDGKVQPNMSRKFGLQSNLPDARFINFDEQQTTFGPVVMATPSENHQSTMSKGFLGKISQMVEQEKSNQTSFDGSKLSPQQEASMRSSRLYEQLKEKSSVVTANQVYERIAQQHQLDLARQNPAAYMQREQDRMAQESFSRQFTQSPSGTFSPKGARKPKWKTSAKVRREHEKSESKDATSSKNEPVVPVYDTATLVRRKYAMKKTDEGYREHEHMLQRATTLWQRRKLRLSVAQEEGTITYDPARLNRDTLEEIGETKLASQKVYSRLFDHVSQDQKMISLIMIQDDGGLEQIGGDSSEFAKDKDDEELLQYIRFLTGVEKKQNAGDLQLVGQQSTLSLLFEQYVDNEVNVMDEVARKLEEKIRFIDVMKYAHTAGIQLKHARDPSFQYYLKCEEFNENVLPVLHYVTKKTLCLQSYTLSIGHANALATACEFFEDIGINRMIFDNCGIDDEEFAAILAGCQKLRDFKQIIYRYNVFKQESLDSLHPILMKRIPNHLEELRIENCKMGEDITAQLLEILTEKCYLKRLALVNVGITDLTFQAFCELVENSEYLEEFDISWAQVRPALVGDLMEILSSNTRLKTINLSQIQLIEGQVRTRVDGEGTYEDQAALTESAKFSIKCLCKFIKRNKNLLHVDLSYTGLSELQLWEFGAALRRAKSMRSIHLSGNKITKRLVQHLVDRAHCIYVGQHNDIPFRDLPSNVWAKDKASQLNKAESARVSSQYASELGSALPMRTPRGPHGDDSPHRDKVLKAQKLQRAPTIAGFLDQQLNDGLGNITPAQQELLTARMGEAAQLQYLQRQKRLEQNLPEVEAPDKDVLIVTRKLGHKDDMPGSGQWHVYDKSHKGVNHCWLCDHQVYSMIFWNQEIGEVHSQSFDCDDLDFIIGHLDRINKDGKAEQKLRESFKPGDDQCPLIYGQFTNWEPKRMFDIREFCDRMNQDKPDIFELCQKKKLIDQDVRSVEKLNEDDRKNYEREVRFYYNSYKKIWRDIVQKYMKYKKPQLVNANMRKQLNNQQLPLYVYVTFMRCGKQHYVVRHTDQATGETQYYPSSTLAKHREEEIPLYRKHFRRVLIQRKFIKEASVFANWKLDDNAILKKALDHDVRYWKLPKFCKDKVDQENCFKAVKKRFAFLKATHLHMCSKSMFPATFMNDFTAWARKAKFMDKNFKQSALDRAFIAANFEMEEQDDNPDKALIRFEFIEVLLRVAKEKYQKTGECETLADAFNLLLDRNVEPVSGHAEWQGFRDKELYQVEVNDVLQANSDLLKKVYLLKTTPTQKQLLFDDALSLFTTRSEVGLNLKDATYCFGMSKMTVPQENEDAKKYNSMFFVEFLEMIGRVAYIKFQGSELETIPLHKKIEFIIDDLLALTPGAKRKIVSYEPEEETESDSDY